MRKKYKGKYRGETFRLKNWDYRWDAAYFLTICTKDRNHYFGEIENGKIKLSPAGAIAHVLWQEMKNRLENIELGEFVVMPNHIHGILILTGNMDRGDGGDGWSGGDGWDVACNIPTGVGEMDNNNPPTNKTDIQKRMSDISPKSNSISTIIRSYKSAVTKYCNRLEIPFGWQSLFHDHIIRDGGSYGRISQYIINNPSRWEADKIKYKDL